MAKKVVSTQKLVIPKTQKFDKNMTMGTMQFKQTEMKSITTSFKDTGMFAKPKRSINATSMYESSLCFSKPP